MYSVIWDSQTQRCPLRLASHYNDCRESCVVSRFLGRRVYEPLHTEPAHVVVVYPIHGCRASVEGATTSLDSGRLSVSFKRLEGAAIH
ncbi:hypothetical protein J6590_023701 [Homalodisca vitripennis]|nr:hypothetical protein J6590_023701 [Homalodisca vitripennis]